MVSSVTQSYLENNFVRPTTLLNGGFDFWQRGSSLAESEITAFSNYSADQWQITFPVSQLLTTQRITDFVTSNKKSSKALQLTLSSATSSLTASTQYGISQKIEGIYARELLYKPVTFAGKVKTNLAGTYTAYISWVDTASSNYYYCAVPIILAGTGSEESFTAVFPPCPTTFTPETGEAYSVKVGLILAGVATSVTGIYLTCPAASETYSHSSQANLFASASNYMSFSQLVLNPGSQAKVYFMDSYDTQLQLCRRYVERKTLASHLVNLYANTTSHVGSLTYERKRSSPSFTFQQTDESKASISNSSAVYYVGGNTAFTLNTFAAAGRTTTSSTGFTFTTTSATPVGVDTGNLNLDVVVISNL